MLRRYDITVDGHKMVALGNNETATNTPIILMHGIGLSASFWPEDGAGTVDGKRWYALCLPGHYPAAFSEGFQRSELTAELIARLVSRSIQELVGDQPVILFGHSTGGFAALATAAQYPKQVKAVISVSGFVQGRWGGPLALMQKQMQWGSFGEAMFRSAWRTVMVTPRVYYYSSGLYTHDWRSYFAYPDLYMHTKRVFADVRQLDLHGLAHYFARMPQTDIQDWLPRIAAPTLAITGEQDRIVPPEQARQIAQQVPNAKLVTIPNSGHMVMIEQPTPYKAAINGFLGQYA